jgi:hypothetical protein
MGMADATDMLHLATGPWGCRADDVRRSQVGPAKQLGHQVFGSM